MNKIVKYEESQLQTYADVIGLPDEEILKQGKYLYHGIRIDAINTLESIFQDGNILCGNRINSNFISYDGSTKQILIDYNNEQNCNMGKYISVMPECDDVEFDAFVRENLFFAIKGTVRALKTKYLPYTEYCDLRKNNINDDLYSYACNEYLVKDKISLDDVVFIGIDSCYYNGDYNNTVKSVIDLMNVYKIEIPFIDIKTNKELFKLNETNERVKTKRLVMQK